MRKKKGNIFAGGKILLRRIQMKCRLMCVTHTECVIILINVHMYNWSTLSIVMCAYVNHMQSIRTINASQRTHTQRITWRKRTTTYDEWILMWKLVLYLVSRSVMNDVMEAIKWTRCSKRKVDNPINLNTTWMLTWIYD